MAGIVDLTDLERTLRLFGSALWGDIFVLRPEAPVEGRAARPSFAGSLVRLPANVRGLPAEQARQAYRASIAHIAAHRSFGGARFPVGKLKPLQVALISLIEDARVESLAVRALPGLRRLWLPFHVAQPGEALTATTLMARLARALIDPDYADDDAWVGKGRQLFLDAMREGQGAEASRRIGGLLGNDLGQMRIQFNARTYVVEPLYRDDNAGLWDFGEQAGVQDDAEALPQPARRQHEGHGDSGRADTEPAGRARARAADEGSGVPVARYPEWDYARRAERPDWTTVLDYPPAERDSLRVRVMVARRQVLERRMSALVRSARVSRPVRLRRQGEGEQLDLDAALAAVIDRRTGHAPDPRVYVRFERRARDLCVLMLLDASQSTNEAAYAAGPSVLEMEVDSAALIARALQDSGDPFALRAFCSNRRAEIRYLRLKDFVEPYSEQVERRLSGLQGRFSTRIGAALRHAGSELIDRRSYRRLLLVMSDGEPSDVDVADPHYLIEDARRAVLGLQAAGIDLFCIGLGGRAEQDLVRIFGPRNVLHVDRLERLPERLAALYMRLTS